MVFSSEEMDTVEEDEYLNNGHRKHLSSSTAAAAAGTTTTSGIIGNDGGDNIDLNTTTPIITDLNLEPCPICGRTFIPNTLIKHIGICEKMMTKKRKIFDSSRQRREGTDLALLPPPKLEQHKLSPPRTILPQRKQSDTHLIKRNVTGTVTATQSPKLNVPIKQRNLGPVSEQCPHCDRCFGMKAYDRHVEWCKEKMRLTNSQTTPTLNVAKERLQARTQYRAPAVKTKREMTRRKYSGCEDSVFDFPTSMSKSMMSGTSDDKRSMHNSMTSSTTSEGALSDNYDPFISAKRQLEELFSPTQIYSSTPTSASTPTYQNKIQLKNYSTPTSSSLSRSLQNQTNNSNNTTGNLLTNVKSNFKRTSSLRVPKTNKITKQLFTTTINKKPVTTIQRGLSIDDGPISTNFLKSDEFDEMPVKAAYIPIIKQPLILRDPNSVARRKELKLDLKQRSNNNLNNLNNNNNNTADNNQLTKTDSMAVFLKYEHDLSISPTLTEKEIKDKNNSFNKRLSSISSGTPEKSPDLRINTNTNNNNNHGEMIIKKSSSTSSSSSMTTGTIHSSGLVTGTTQSQQPAVFLFPDIRRDQHFIDPKLINLCDNLTINVTKLTDDDDDDDDENDRNNNDDVDSNEIISRVETNLSLTPKPQMITTKPKLHTTTKHTTTTTTQLPNFRIDNKIVTNNNNNNSNSNNNSQRNSGEQQRRLKRQVKLSKNNFLYDNLTDDNNPTDIYSDNCDKTISMIDQNDFYKTTINNNNNNNSTDAMFDDFDLEEFISSFEDDDQYPIFKDYKELLAKTTSSQHSQQQMPIQQTLTYKNKSKSVTPTFRLSSSRENIIDTNSGETFIQERALILSSLETLKSKKLDNFDIIADNPNVKHHHNEDDNDDNEEDDHGDDDDDDEDDEEENSVQLSSLLERKDGNIINSEVCSPIEMLSPYKETLNEIEPKKLEELTRAERELLKSVQELDRMCESSTTMYPIDSDVSSVESFPMSRKLGSKFSADSAYGSLSRQSPIDRPIRRNIQRVRQNNDGNISSGGGVGGFGSGGGGGGNIGIGNIIGTKIKNHNSKNDIRIRDNNSLSSSGSDTSLPPIQTQKSELHNKDKCQLIIDTRMSKFCHECGSKFMINQAKFCMECGVRRVMID